MIVMTFPPAKTILPAPEHELRNADEVRTYPKSRTMRAKILGLFLLGESLTRRECWWLLGCPKLEHHELMLRKAGWAILIKRAPASLARSGGLSDSIYYLPASMAMAVGERGQRFAKAQAGHFFEKQEG